MDVEVTADMWAAFEARYLFDLGLEEAIEQVLVPLIASQVEAATIERCANMKADMLLDARNAIAIMEDWPDDLPQWCDDSDDEDGVLGLAAYAKDGMCVGSVSFGGGRIIYASTHADSGNPIAGNTDNADEALEVLATAIRSLSEGEKG